MLGRSSDLAAIEAEIDRVRSLGLDELRTLWRTTLRSSPPPAFTKDLVARFICWHIQEQALGGLDPDTAKLLDSLARGDKPGADGPRRLKPGTAGQSWHVRPGVVHEVKAGDRTTSVLAMYVVEKGKPLATPWQQSQG